MWSEVKVFSNRIEAELAKSALDSAGIPTRIQSDDQGGMRPQLAFSSGVRLLVPTEKLEEAKTLLSN